MLSLLRTSSSLVRAFSKPLLSSSQLSAANIIAIRLQTRRSLFTSPALALPTLAQGTESESAPAKSKAGRRAKPTTPKKSSKSAPAKKTKGTSLRAKKVAKKAPSKKVAKKVVRKRKKPAKKPVKKPDVLVKKLKVPGPAPNPYILFLVDQYLSGKTLHREDIIQSAAESAREWRSFTIGQKQPYIDKHRALSEENKKKREEFLRDMDPKLLLRLNKYRVSRGKPKFHKPRPEVDQRQPLTSYFRFLMEFRSTPEGQAIHNEGTKDGRPSCIRLTSVAGEHWRNLSADAKKRYEDESKKERTEWKARHGTAT